LITVTWCSRKRSAAADFLFVVGNDIGFALTAVGDHLGQYIGVTLQQRFGGLFKAREQVGIHDQPVLDYFGKTGGEFSIG